MLLINIMPPFVHPKKSRFQKYLDIKIFNLMAELKVSILYNVIHFNFYFIFK